MDELTPIIKFASQPFLMHLTSNYIKKIPMIISATLTFAKPTKNNYNPINFQNFHSDLLDESVLHLVIPIRNIYILKMGLLLLYTLPHQKELLKQQIIGRKNF